jgi:hypothetical protein
VLRYVSVTVCVVFLGAVLTYRVIFEYEYCAAHQVPLFARIPLSIQPAPLIVKLS